MYKFDLDADLRSVYKRLAMANNIEVSVTPSGTTKVYCGKCADYTYSGQPVCCQWAVDMLVKYFTTSRSYPDVVEVDPDSELARRLNVPNRALPE
jgi:hypothetical protein